MGTTLTGTTPQDTYDSLIKVTDNGPLTGSLKVLTDGLGNDSALALSTSAASVTGTLAVTGASTLSSSFRINTTSGAGNFITLNDGNVAFGAALGLGSGGDFVLSSIASNIVTERFRITRSAGVLELAQGQIKFPATQVPSADSNTLDDYEEGTWTIGVSFGGASVAVTAALNGGTYTKIGRQVTVNGILALTSKGSSSGSAKITGLPFTIANNNANYSAVTFRFANITFANQFIGYGEINTTFIDLNEVTEAGVLTALTDADFANNSEVMISLTYFV